MYYTDYLKRTFNANIMISIINASAVPFYILSTVLLFSLRRGIGFFNLSGEIIIQLMNN